MVAVALAVVEARALTVAQVVWVQRAVWKNSRSSWASAFFLVATVAQVDEGVMAVAEAVVKGVSVLMSLLLAIVDPKSTIRC